MKAYDVENKTYLDGDFESVADAVSWLLSLEGDEAKRYTIEDPDNPTQSLDKAGAELLGENGAVEFFK